MIPDLLLPTKLTFKRTHRYVMEAVENLSDRELTAQANMSSPSIAFHLWHLARYADSLQATINISTAQIWTSEDLAMRWGLDRCELGLDERGTDMKDDALDRIRLPGRDALLEYARRTFEVVDEAVEDLSSDSYLKIVSDPAFESGADVALGFLITSALTHNNRHLGMIEALKGVLGIRGTATI